MMSQRRNLALAPVGASAIDDEHILDAAYELFSSLGPRRLTMADVARHTGVSRATLYRRWPNVRSLIGAMVTREWATLADTIGPISDGTTGTTGAAGAAGTARASLVGVVVGLVKAIRDHPLLRGIVDRDPEFLLPYLLQRRGSSTEMQLTMLIGAIRAGQAEGAVRAGRPELLAQAMLLAATSFVLSARAIAADDAGVDDLDGELAVLLDRYLTP